MQKLKREVKNMKYDNRTLAHNFFYEGGCGNGNNCHYNEDKYFSYSTCIGLIYTNKQGQRTLFISNSNFSTTTAKHIHYLRNACPFQVKEAFFAYGRSFVNIETLANIANEHIKDEMDKKSVYLRKPERDFAQKILQVAEDLHNIAGQKIPLLNRYKKYLEKKLNTENIKAEKAKEKARIKREQAKQEREIKAFKNSIKDIPLLQVIKDLVFNKVGITPNYDKELYKKRDLLYRSFAVEYPSFVIVEDNKVITSQHITMDVSEILPLLKAWKHKHNIVGQKLGWYTVLVNNDKMVKVGCHNIPVENVQALADTLLNKQK